MKNKTILIVNDDENDLSDLKNIIDTKYRSFMIDNSSHDFEKIMKQAENLVCAIVCVSDAVSDNYALFDYISEGSIFSSVPLLVFYNGEKDTEKAVECIKRGAVDVIERPFENQIVFNRIENAIRLVDSRTFYEIESMLKKLPSNIYLKDEKGRYVFATHYWHHLEHDDPNWTIRGKTDIEIRKDKENALKAMQTDKEIIKRKKGTSYIIEENADGLKEYLELIKEPLIDENGNVTGIIALINNVTERELLRISLEERAVKDEMTGVYNRYGLERYIGQINNEKTFPVAFISADCNDLKLINDNYSHLIGDEYIRLAVLLFRMVLPEKAEYSAQAVTNFL